MLFTIVHSFPQAGRSLDSCFTPTTTEFQRPTVQHTPPKEEPLLLTMKQRMPVPPRIAAPQVPTQFEMTQSMKYVPKEVKLPPATVIAPPPASLFPSLPFGSLPSSLVDPSRNVKPVKVLPHPFSTTLTHRIPSAPRPSALAVPSSFTVEILPTMCVLSRDPTASKKSFFATTKRLVRLLYEQ